MRQRQIDLLRVLGGLSALIAITTFVFGKSRLSEYMPNQSEVQTSAVQASPPETFTAQPPIVQAQPVLPAVAKSPPPITKVDDHLTQQSVHLLVLNWRDDQNRNDFASYVSCYSPDFVGMKRTKTQKVSAYDYRTWMQDRAAMMNSGVVQTVEVRNIQIAVQDETATVNFDQYYHSHKYSDWGPKTLKVRYTPTGPKIYFEELKASYPLN